MDTIIYKINEFFQENGRVLLESLIILVIGIIIIRIIIALVKKGLKKQSKIDPIVFPYIRSAIKAILYIVLFITVAAHLGLSMTSLLTILGTAGLAVSLALQSSLSNMVNGVFIMISKPFARGDFVSIEGVDGTVESIGLVYTKLKTFDRQVLIPNSDVAGAKISDISVVSERRCDIVFTVSRDDDIDHVRNIVLIVIKNMGELSLEDPAPAVIVTGLSANGTDISVRVWVTQGNYWSFRNKIFEEIKKAFGKEGIVIPGNVTDLIK